MSLRLWLPLNGNIDNLGISNIVFTNSDTTAITSSSGGKLGQCYSFNSTANNNGIYSNDYGFMSNYINNKSWGICAWVKTTANNTPAVSLTYGLRLHAGDASSTYITLYNSSRTVTCPSNIAVNDGLWHHLAATYNVTTNLISIYVDGVLANSQSYTSGYTYESSWTNGLFVGKNPNNSTVSDLYLFKGNLNDVRVYDHCLSAKEVKEISQCLVLHYKFNERENKNLILNGFGELGTTNWSSSSAISTTEIPSDHSEIKASFYNGNTSVEYTPIIPSHSYNFSLWIKSSDSSTTYPSFRTYDIDKLEITHQLCPDGFKVDTLTTLAQPLNTGDTVIYATDLSNWITTSGNHYDVCIIFGYTDSTGYQYPDLTYSRNVGVFASGTDAKTNIDKTNNTITLTSAYNGQPKPAGTSICQSTYGGTYYYPFGGIAASAISDWTYYSKVLKPTEINRLKSAKYVRYLAYSHAYHAGINLVDENIPGIVPDSSGYNNFGKFSGNIFASGPNTDGRYDFGSYLPDGSTDYITSNTVGFSNNSITMNIWFKSSNQSAGSGYHEIFNSEQTSKLEMAVSSAGVIRFGIYIGGTRYVANGTSSVATNGNWHMLTLTYDGAIIKRYIDGVMESSTAISGTMDLSSSKFIFGHYGTNTSYAVKEGSLSDARLYSTALSESDIKELYNTSMNIDNLGGLHSFEGVEKSGNKLVDSSILSNYNSTSVTWDGDKNQYTIISPVGTAGRYGLIVQNKPVFSWGKKYRLCFEVYVPITTNFNIDYNNFSINPGVTLTGNDNDDNSFRINTSFTVQANTWTAVSFGTYNYNGTKNPSHVDLYDNSNFGIKTDSATDPVTWYLRNPRWYLIDPSTSSTDFQTYKNGIYNTNFITESNINSFASLKGENRESLITNLVEK